MLLSKNSIYHICNRGNNKQNIFFNRIIYIFFLKKIENELVPNCDLMAYCLMPNHFHLLIYASPYFKPEIFHNKYKVFLSSYTRAINKQQGRTGSLFQQNSKMKGLVDFKYDDNNVRMDYPTACFHYIHQNPIRAKLVSRLEDWEFSSFRDYVGLRNDSICNRELTKKVVRITR